MFRSTLLPLSPFRSLDRSAVLLMAACFFGQARATRAEGAISYKYHDYREADDRITVESHYGMIEAALGPAMRFKAHGVIDAIAGATPTGEPPATPDGPVPLSEIEDRRKGWSAELSRQFPRVNAAVGVANSRESDYVSTGWSLNTTTDFNQKNTTLLLGVAGTDDDIKVFYQTDWVKKRTTDLVAGVTQLLNPNTAVTVNVGYGHSSGFHADPYRLIFKRVEIAPGVFLPRTFNENRPDSRDKWTIFAALNRAFPQANGALEASYRLFRDDFGITAHTLELAWFQKFGGRFMLRPAIRLYEQTEADFYRLDLTGTDITPTNGPNPAGPFFSADYRVSAFWSHTLGLKGVWMVSDAWQVDATLEHYEMRGKDNATSPHVYPRAAIVTIGARFGW
jgi:hypothetical protein